MYVIFFPDLRSELGEGRTAAGVRDRRAQRSEFRQDNHPQGRASKVCRNTEAQAAHEGDQRTQRAADPRTQSNPRRGQLVLQKVHQEVARQPERVSTAQAQVHRGLQP